MAEADLEIAILQIEKVKNKSLMAAVKKRRDQIMARAAKAKDKASRDQLRLMAKSTMLLGTAAVKRLQNSAEIAADSYARAIRHAAGEAKKAAVATPAKKTDGGKASGNRGGESEVSLAKARGPLRVISPPAADPTTSSTPPSFC